MLKLNTELELEQPKIINKPFTSIKEMLNNVVDIDDDEHFKGIKERLEISKRQVDEAIQQFEEGNVETTEEIKKTLEIDLLKKEIIDLLIKQSYQKENIERIENNAKLLKNKEINSLLAGLYSDWGTYLGNLAKTKKGKEAEELYNQAFEKFQKAIEIKPDKHEAFNNWGNDLGNLAKTKKGKEAEELYNQAFEKLKKAVVLGGKSYNLACLYAVIGKKTKALEFLEKCLQKQEIKISYVKEDPDWEKYLEDSDFIKLLKK